MTMQIKLFNVPVFGGDEAMDEMNLFLRATKVLQVENHLISDTSGTFWSFCVKYLETSEPAKKARVDYMEVLDRESFQRFAHMRKIRKQVATDEGIPAYAVFTDAQLAELAKLEVLTPGTMEKVNGIGEKKVARYGKFFISEENGDLKS